MTITALVTIDPASDFYDIEALLEPQDRALVRRVRAFMEEHVDSIINRYWARAEFPFEVVPGLRELGIVGISYHGYGFPGRSRLVSGTIAMELARVDPSIATFFGAHAGLAAGSILLCGSEEQKQRYHAPNTVGNFCFEVTLGYRRLERGR